MATRKSKVVEGRVLKNNRAAEVKYASALREVTLLMMRVTLREVRRAMETEAAKEFHAMDAAPQGGLTAILEKTMNGLSLRFQSLFDTESWRLSTGMVSNVSKLSEGNLKGSLKKALSDEAAIRVPPMTGRLGQIYDAAVSENVGLIKSVPEKYLREVQGAVMRSVTHGQGLSELIPVVQRLNGQTTRRVANLARDQTRKVYNSVNSARMQEMGVKSFKWIHSGGANEPRPLHVSYNGKIFRFDDLPVIDERTGEKGIPGQAINCGCTMVPVLIFDDDEDEKHAVEKGI